MSSNSWDALLNLVNTEMFIISMGPYFLTRRVPNIARSIGYTRLTFGKSVDRRIKPGLILLLRVLSVLDRASLTVEK